MNPYKYTLKDEYELALKIGDKRFGNACKHEKVKNGHCQNCLRKVVFKIRMASKKT